MNKQRNNRALITGASGQDGSYLAELLVAKGYEVHVLVRRTSNDPFTRLQNVKSSLHVHYGNMRDSATIRHALKIARPHEIYNLAAQSHVGVSFECPDETEEVNYHGLGRLVREAMYQNPDIKTYQASTSEMFGSTLPPQNECSRFDPVSPYGRSKLRAHEDYVVGYRERHNLFICSGFLFNHESPRRGENFVTRKISITLAKIALGYQKEPLELGNLNARRDWGFAGDYVRAMWMMLQQDSPDDYVIATGETRSVREWVEETARPLGMNITWEGEGVEEVGYDQDGQEIVRVNSNFYRENEVHDLCGDSTKALEHLCWKPEMSFGQLVRYMLDHELDRFWNKK